MKLATLLMRAAWLSLLVGSVALGRFIVHPSDDDFLVAVASLFAAALLWMCAAVLYNRHLRLTSFSREELEAEYQRYRATLSEAPYFSDPAEYGSYGERADEHWQRFNGWLVKHGKAAR